MYSATNEGEENVVGGAVPNQAASFAQESRERQVPRKAFSTAIFALPILCYLLNEQQCIRFVHLGLVWRGFGAVLTFSASAVPRRRPLWFVDKAI